MRLHITFPNTCVTVVLLGLLLLATVPATAASPTAPRAGTAAPVDIVRDPSDVPPPIAYKAPRLVHVTLTAKEVTGTLDPEANTTYHYWTFDGKVPGPMIRVRQGDTIELTLRNDGNSHMAHSIDLHAVLGPGGGAAFTQAVPGQEKTFSFQATTPGLFVYHCGTPMIAEHIANGMYGLILVEPEAGLPLVDHEYYVMQGELYTAAPKGKEGLQQFSAARLMNDTPDYFVYNGAVDALTAIRAMKASTGQTVRVFFGNAGPNHAAATHAVGEIFTKFYEDGSLTTPPLTNVQTAGVPPGSAAVLEFVAREPGKVGLMDHAISRMAKGLMAVFDISGATNDALIHAGSPTPEQTAQLGPAVTGVTAADQAASLEPIAPANPQAAVHAAAMDRASMIHMGMMDMGAMQPTRPAHGARQISPSAHGTATANQTTTVDGCLTLAPDGRALLSIFHSARTIRLEARPLLFSENANHFVRVSGQYGSVMTVEDPKLPSFVVDTVEPVASNCSSTITTAQIRKVLSKKAAVTHGVVGMSDMGFLPRTIEINAGEKVTWTNSSQVTHNVVDDPGRAVLPIDVKLPSGAKSFGSGMLQPRQTYSRVFDVPGTYHYVCTLHETSGMKGVIIVRGPQVLTAHK
jgi:copper-containing nitrite reductase